jgi:hypothetical protein
VHVTVSPVPSSSALTWIEFAQAALVDELDSDPPLIDDDLATVLRELLASWAAEAHKGPTLALAFDVPAEEGEFLVHAFLRISDRWTTDADQRGFDVSPQEGDEFYGALVEAVITALELAGDASGVEFGASLRSIWPRIERLADQSGGGDPSEPNPRGRT